VVASKVVVVAAENLVVGDEVLAGAATAKVVAAEAKILTAKPWSPPPCCPGCGCNVPGRGGGGRGVSCGGQGRGRGGAATAQVARAAVVLADSQVIGRHNLAAEVVAVMFMLGARYHVRHRVTRPGPPLPLPL
jgi:hypothetical protein